MTDWITRNAIRIIAIVGVVLIVGAFLTLRSCQAERTAKTEAKLATGQAGAAIDSGKDAVNTLGNAQAREAETKTQIQEGTDAINAAPAGDSNAAADRATCRLRSYRNSSKCVALLGPVAK